MTPTQSPSDNLFVANLRQVSLEKIVRSKLAVLLKQYQDGGKITDLYNEVIGQVERPMIELALTLQKGNQVKTAEFLGINRNTLRKKISDLKIRVGRLG